MSTTSSNTSPEIQKYKKIINNIAFSFVICIANFFLVLNVLKNGIVGAYKYVRIDLISIFQMVPLCWKYICNKMPYNISELPSHF